MLCLVVCVGVMSARRWREALCFSVTLLSTCKSSVCVCVGGVRLRSFGRGNSGSSIYYLVTLDMTGLRRTLLSKDT
jgi:hypothetical protein